MCLVQRPWCWLPRKGRENALNKCATVGRCWRAWGSAQGKQISYFPGMSKHVTKVSKLLVQIYDSVSCSFAFSEELSTYNTCPALHHITCSLAPLTHSLVITFWRRLTVSSMSTYFIRCKIPQTSGVWNRPSLSSPHKADTKRRLSSSLSTQFRIHQGPPEDSCGSSQPVSGSGSREGGTRARQPLASDPCCSLRGRARGTSVPMAHRTGAGGTTREPRAARVEHHRAEHRRAASRRPPSAAAPPRPGGSRDALKLRGGGGARSRPANSHPSREACPAGWCLLSFPSSRFLLFHPGREERWLRREALCSPRSEAGGCRGADACGSVLLKTAAGVSKKNPQSQVDHPLG